MLILFVIIIYFKFIINNINRAKTFLICKYNYNFSQYNIYILIFLEITKTVYKIIRTKISCTYSIKYILIEIS